MKRIAVMTVLLSTLVLVGCSETTTIISASFAQCLTDKGVKMYGTQWCSHCQTQKKMFGQAFGNIVFIDCDKQSAACKMAKVTGYPTWIDQKGVLYPGTQSADELARISGCTL